MLWSQDATMPIISLLLVVYWIGVVIALLNDGRDPTKTLAWMLFLYVLPILGLVFYYLFGRNWKKKTAKGKWYPRLLAIATPVMQAVYARYPEAGAEARAWAGERGQGRLVHLISATDGAVPLPAYDVEILVNGEKKFAALKKDLALAKDTINIEYFIWERDELTAALSEILLDRLQAGVEVRMLNDFLGNIMYKKDQLKPLREAGAKIEYDISDIGKANYRNHRKIVVIDSTLGYTGGINVGQEYIDGKPKYPYWRDTHVRFHGPAVADLQKLFAARWHEVTDENLFTERFFPIEYPEHGKRTLAQTVATGVEDKWESARRAHVLAMSRAKDRIWIQSPYFVPTDDIYETMVNAALSGIDVRFMMTGWPDKKIAWHAAESYFRPLVEAGGKVYHYNKGFFHAKTMTIDGQLCAIGTMNMDIRSLELHKELMTWFFDPKLAEEHEGVFERDMEECELITLETIDGYSHLRVLRNSGARLVSNLL